MSQIAFFKGIFNEFLCLDNKFDKYDLWMAFSVIKLLKSSDMINDKIIIEDGLKIILKLYNFTKYRDILDSYELESSPISDLSKIEKGLLNSTLKAELF